MIIKYIVINCVHRMRDVFCQVMSLVLALCAIHLSAYFALGLNNQFNEITFDLSYSRNVFRAQERDLDRESKKKSEGRE